MAMGGVQLRQPDTLTARGTQVNTIKPKPSILPPAAWAAVPLAVVGFFVHAESIPPAGKPAPRPLDRDPVFDAPTDPALCFNAEQNRWFMYYTARRATATNTPGVTWVHGSNIGLAESSDGGATWT